MSSWVTQSVPAAAAGSVLLPGTGTGSAQSLAVPSLLPDLLLEGPAGLIPPGSATGVQEREDEPHSLLIITDHMDTECSDISRRRRGC